MYRVRAESFRKRNLQLSHASVFRCDSSLRRSAARRPEDASERKVHLVESKQPLAEWAAVGCGIARALDQRQTRLTKVEHVRLHQLPKPWLP